MKSRNIVVVMLVSLLAIIPMIPNASATVQPGPRTDILRGKVITSPDAQLLAMMTDVADVSPDQIRMSDIEAQADAGFLITSNRGFHMGYISYNIRDDQSYRVGREEYDGVTKKWPLADADFRHALIHGYNQLAIIPSIYGIIVTPVRSLVPPAQAYWYNPNTPEHQFNLGDPYDPDILINNPHSTVGILVAAGYTFEPAGPGTEDDYWKDPDGNPLPRMLIWTPLESIAPTSWEHGQRFVDDLGTIGLKATTANGDSGMAAEGADFNWYLAKVFDESDFDGYMVFWGLGRFPDQMYLLAHSDFDTRVVPGSYNAPGINDTNLDALLETMMFTIWDPSMGPPDPRREAAFEAQDMLYNPDLPNADNFALAYMLLYSRNYFNAFDQDLKGIVKSPGYGSDNGWTWLNAYMDPNATHIEGGKTVINYIVGEKPESFNPLYASTAYEWFYIGGTMDGLMAVNPFNHEDEQWIATSWELVETGIPATPMKITYTLRSDVKWQDGHDFDAYDAAFNLNFLKDHAIPRYSSIWQFIDSVSVASATEFTVTATETNWILLYDFAGVSAMLPPQVWDRTWPWWDGTGFVDVLDYDPSEPYDTTPTGYPAGPTPPPTNLFGTGPWIFQFYDQSNLYGDLWANRNYFESTGSGTVTTRLREMFWGIGDVDRNAHIWANDYYRLSVSFGYFLGELQYDVDADFDKDGYISIADMANAAFHIDWYLDESLRP